MLMVDTESISNFADMAKNNYDISRQMQQDLMKAYIDVCPSCWSQKEAYEKTAAHPAPRYYVSPKQALQILSPMMRGDFEQVNLMHPHKQRLYHSLFEEVKKLSEQRRFEGRALSYLTQFAVLQPAPEFFIGWDRVKRIRSWIKRGVFDESGKVNAEVLRFYTKQRS